MDGQYPRCSDDLRKRPSVVAGCHYRVPCIAISLGKAANGLGAVGGHRFRCGLRLAKSTRHDPGLLKTMTYHSDKHHQQHASAHMPQVVLQVAVYICKVIAPSSMPLPQPEHAAGCNIDAAWLCRLDHSWRRPGKPGISGGSTSFCSPPPRPAPDPSLFKYTSTPCATFDISAADECTESHGRSAWSWPLRQKTDSPAVQRSPRRILPRTGYGLYVCPLCESSAKQAEEGTHTARASLCW